MNKTLKVWLIVAGSLVAVGLILIGVCVFCFGDMLAKDFEEKYETNTFDITEPFRDISISGETEDIVFEISPDENCHIASYHHIHVINNVSVENGTLTVTTDDQRKWNEYVDINFKQPTITVYLPAGEYSSLMIRETTGDIKIPSNFSFETVDVSLSTGDINCYASVSERMKIETTTGDILVADCSVGSMEINVTTGDATVSDVRCDTFLSTGTTGEILLKDVIVSGKLSVERSTGDVCFERSDAGEINVENKTGDVAGSLLSEKVFLTETATGSVSVPKTAAGGTCTINTTTGDIKITIAQ